MTVLPPPPIQDLQLPHQLKNLVDSSSCDILPEQDTADIIGDRAHSRGYPRLVGEDIRFDLITPHETPDSLVVWALTEGLTFENEVHDCQRLVFVTATDSSFGPLVGVLPLDGAMNLLDAAFDSGVVVATVHNWGDFYGFPQSYDALRIDAGWNCLWLRRDSAQWSAAMTSDGDIPCFDRPPPPPWEYDLDVQRVIHSDSVTPKTARWGWDHGAAVHTIGVKCGSEWCWVGPPALFDDAVAEAGGPAFMSPGYIDEQHLAVPRSGGIVPGPYARVSPTAEYYQLATDQLASSQDITSSFFSEGRPVARIETPGFEGATPFPYDSLWGSTSRPVILHLSRSALTAPMMSNFRTAAGAQLKPEQRSRRIVGMSHSAVGTVRWRWHDTAGTETIWSACGEKLTDCCDTDNRPK